MTRPSWSGLPLLASALAHAAVGWQLYAMRVAPAEPLARDTLVVRTVELPRPPEPPKPEPPKPEPPKPEPPKPEPPKPRPKLEPPAPKVEPPPASEPAAPPPQPAVTAPAALLAEPSPGAAGGVVQIAGAPLAAWAPSAAPPSAPLPTHAPLGAAAAPFAKLSDLSRKPRAPALDGALRDNYPPEQRRRGVEGQAEVQVVIEHSGRVGEISVLSETAAGFAEACRRTLRGSVWSEPIGRDGQPVRTRLSYRCRFRIER